MYASALNNHGQTHTQEMFKIEKYFALNEGLMGTKTAKKKTADISWEICLQGEGRCYSRSRDGHFWPATGNVNVTQEGNFLVTGEGNSGKFLNLSIEEFFSKQW